MKNLPQDIQDAIEVCKSIQELIDEDVFYKELDWLDDSEKIKRIHEYRDKVFFILKKLNQ